GERALAAPLPAASVTLGDETFLNDAWRDLAGRGAASARAPRRTLGATAIAAAERITKSRRRTPDL
ncbi:MAG: hypothetical protein IAI48_07655, partial [Candidatus Eremiobacteraeota bacterium]|nr:hypothetical protein [Candidatus Eremiobacteraeota bacterium]